MSRSCPVHVAPSTSAFRGSSGSLKSLRFPSRGAMTEEAGDAAGADPEKKWTKRDLRHTSAVVICPPSSQWGPIQEIRSFNDKSYARWMPHINLLYPFLLDDDHGDDAPRRNFDAATAVAGSARRHRAVHGDASVFSDASSTPRAAPCGSTRANPSRETTRGAATSRTPTSRAHRPSREGSRRPKPRWNARFRSRTTSRRYPRTPDTPAPLRRTVGRRRAGVGGGDRVAGRVGAIDVRGGRRVLNISRGRGCAVRIQG